MATKQFETKTSGKKEEFSTGYARDNQEGKTRYDLVPVESLKRLAELYGRGAKLYNDDNWKKGAPYKRMYASMLRHMYQWRQGDTSEDHLAALAWGAFALMYYEEQIAAGKIPKELDDRKA